jgi:hypothetical protein
MEFNDGPTAVGDAMEESDLPTDADCEHSVNYSSPVNVTKAGKLAFVLQCYTNHWPNTLKLKN